MSECRERAPRSVPTRLVAASPSMRAVLRLVERLAPAKLPVLILGETGVGKELVAAELHQASGRSGEFIAVNCAAIPDGLAESELFGHERGAFTGASDTRRGYFEEARGGTLMLDEIAELPLPLQAKLLRVLAENRIRRVGASRSTSIDVRLVAATHRDLAAAVRAGAFRADLFWRLAGVAITVPPLRDRRADIRPITEAILAEVAAGRPKPTIPPLTMTWLEGQPWPGNIRELRQAIERAVILGGDELVPEDFALERGPTASRLDLAVPAAWPAPRHAETQRGELEAALAAHRTIRGAARALGIPKSTLADRARRYGLGVRECDDTPDQPGRGAFP